jgi:hypothetical protein
LSALAEFQRRMASRILRDPPEESAEVHVNTVFSTLVHALRLTFPSVAQLTGESRFHELGMQYSRTYPPCSSVLYSYGGHFPEHVRSNAVARELPYLSDVARFDLQIDQAGHRVADAYGDPIVIDPHLDIQLPCSLAWLQTDYPVDLIRDALDVGRHDPLRGIDMNPGSLFFAIWRSSRGAGVKRLRPASAAFLNTLLKGGDAEHALRRASEEAPLTEAVVAIQTDLLAASFVRLIWHSTPGIPG